MERSMRVTLKFDGEAVALIDRADPPAYTSKSRKQHTVVGSLRNRGQVPAPLLRSRCSVRAMPGGAVPPRTPRPGGGHAKLRPM